MNVFRAFKRAGLPGFIVSGLYWLKFGCYISPRAEIDHDPSIKIGRATRISAFSQIKAAGQLHIGSNVSINVGCCIAAGAGGILIGDDCLFGPRVVVLGSSNIYSRVDLPIREQGMTSKGVRIGNNVWLGAGAVILDGSEVGEGVIVAPNSVVASSLPPNTICEGNPAKPVFRRR